MSSLARVAVVSLSSLFLGSAVASAGTYSYRVDDASIAGNNPGFVFDDFDDGVVAPWEVSGAPMGGVVGESGGFLILESPGVVEDPSNLAGTWGQEFTGAFQSGSWAVIDGLGDFTMSSTWEGATPAVDQAVSMDFITQLPDDTWEQWFVSVSNPSPAVAAAFGVAPGLQVTFSRFDRLDNPDPVGSPELCCGPITASSIETFPIAAVTGDITFNIYFDDFLNELSADVSVDGGSTFTPFSSVASQFSTGGVIGLGARQFTAPEPSTLLLMAGGLGAVGLRRRGAGVA